MGTAVTPLLILSHAMAQEVPQDELEEIVYLVHGSLDALLSNQAHQLIVSQQNLWEIMVLPN